MIKKSLKKNIIVFILGFIWVMGIQACQALTESVNPGTYQLMLNTQGHRWRYDLYIPPQYNPNTPTPLVITLHGTGGNGRYHLNQASWKDKADEAGFIVVAPYGQPVVPGRPRATRLWNVSLRPSSPRSQIDDVQFFRVLLNKLQRNLNIDQNRIYVVGHSNGGEMAFLLGRKLSKKLAAIAAVASITPIGSPFLNQTSTIPLSTLYITGTKDPLVPLAGGRILLPSGRERNIPPLMEFLDNWAKNMDCEAHPQVVESNSNFQKMSYNDCGNKVNYVVYLIDNHGHSWPGGKRQPPLEKLGPNNPSFKATDVIWDFFRQQKRSN